MKIYISLPIDTPGYNYITQWRIAKKFQRLFEADGHIVINPFDLADQLDKAWMMVGGKPPTRREYLDRDLDNIPFCTHIFLCNGWQESEGCIEEAEEATFYNVTFLYERNYDTTRRSGRNARIFGAAMLG